MGLVLRLQRSTTPCPIATRIRTRSGRVPAGFMAVARRRNRLRWPVLIWYRGADQRHRYRGRCRLSSRSSPWALLPTAYRQALDVFGEKEDTMPEVTVHTPHTPSWVDLAS